MIVKKLLEALRNLWDSPNKEQTCPTFTQETWGNIRSFYEDNRRRLRRSRFNIFADPLPYYPRKEEPQMDPPVIKNPPHRGFNPKSRAVLIGPSGMPGGLGMSGKSASEFDLRKKYNVFNTRKPNSNGSSPKSQSSVSSIPEQPSFDTIGERPTVKKHMKLSDIGKAHSCAELKSDKRLLRTFQEENIIKMPSMDSDIGSPVRSELDDLCLSFEGIGKSMLYSQSDNNSNDVKEKKKTGKK